MKKAIQMTALLMLSICLPFCLTACFVPGTLGDTEYYDAELVLEKAVPLFTIMDSYDRVHFDKVIRLDSDKYGRILYEYTTCTFDKPSNYMSFLVVCQTFAGDRSTSFTTSWYDNCWMAKYRQKSKGHAEFSDDEIAELKQLNDWGKPLDSSRLNYAFYTNISVMEDQEKKDYLRELRRIDEQRSEIFGYIKENFEGYRARNMIFKDDSVFMFIETENKEYMFVQYDYKNKQVIKTRQYDGEFLKCQEPFISFMNESEV